MTLRLDIQGLELQDVNFAFDEGQPVFEGISFKLPTAPAVWVRSPGGGRGKSTLLKILSGLLTPQSGRVLINGQNVSEMSFEEFLKFRLNIGYGFDMGGLLNNRTIAENLLLPLHYHKLLSSSQARARVDEIVERFGMQALRDLRPFAVSGSQRKLSCVLRALVHWPQVVFLDDPATGLKRENLEEMYRFIAEGFTARGLRQMFFTSESSEWAGQFHAQELIISQDHFVVKKAAA